VTAFLPELERALEHFAPRPHWGKLFSLGAGPITHLYPRISDFTRLAIALDPDRRYRNEYLERVVFGVD
jgi:alditol oxidase